MIKPEKFDHLHLVYYFTVPLKLVPAISYHIFIFSPNNNFLKTKNVFYFIEKALLVLKIFNCLYFFSSFSNIPDSKGQMQME